MNLRNKSIILNNIYKIGVEYFYMILSVVKQSDLSLQIQITLLLKLLRVREYTIPKCYSCL